MTDLIKYIQESEVRYLKSKKYSEFYKKFLKYRKKL